MGPRPSRKSREYIQIICKSFVRVFLFLISFHGALGTPPHVVPVQVYNVPAGTPLDQEATWPGSIDVKSYICTCIFCDESIHWVGKIGFDLLLGSMNSPIRFVFVQHREACTARGSVSLLGPVWADNDLCEDTSVVLGRPNRKGLNWKFILTRPGLAPLPPQPLSPSPSFTRRHTAEQFTGLGISPNGHLYLSEEIYVGGSGGIADLYIPPATTFNQNPDVINPDGTGTLIYFDRVLVSSSVCKNCPPCPSCPSLSA
jgi:hypothetical protein